MEVLLIIGLLVFGFLFYKEGRRLYKRRKNIRNYKELQSR